MLGNCYSSGRILINGCAAVNGKSSPQRTKVSGNGNSVRTFARAQRRHPEVAIVCPPVPPLRRLLGKVIGNQCLFGDETGPVPAVLVVFNLLARLAAGAGPRVRPQRGCRSRLRSVLGRMDSYSILRVAWPARSGPPVICLLQEKTLPVIVLLSACSCAALCLENFLTSF